VKAYKYGILGGIFSFILFILLVMVLRTDNGEGIVIAGTIVLSTVICTCTGIIVEELKNAK